MTGAIEESAADAVRKALERLLQEQNDARAWEVFIAQTWPFVRASCGRVVRRLPGARIEADDLSQEVFTSFARELKGGSLVPPPDTSDWKAWVKGLLYRLIVRTCNTQARRNLRRRSLLPLLVRRQSKIGAAEPTAPEWAAYHDLLRRLDDRLSARRREVLRMLLEGYSQAEVAVKSQCSLKTVQRDVQEIRELLHSVIGAEQG